MIGTLLILALIVSIALENVASRQASKKRPSTLRWVGHCNCRGKHRPDCYAGMEHWDIGVTLPKKFNFPEDEWYDPHLPFWEDEKTREQP